MKENSNETKQAERSEPIRKDYFWKGAVIVLAGVVCIQSYLTYRALESRHGKSSAGNRAVTESADSISLRPRTPSASSVPQAVSSVQQPKQPSLSPPPLPKLNVNVSNLPGVKPSITPSQQQQQPSCGAIQFSQGRSAQAGFPRHNMSPFSSMNINISPDPFGFGMNIREEMERMEKMMNAMMSGSGFSGFGNMGIPSGMRSFSFSSPGMDMPRITLDKENNYVVTLKIPGLDKSQIKAEVNGNLLSVSGVQKEEKRYSGRGTSSYISSYSSFQNTFPLPGPAKSTGLQIDYRNNILTIKVPKA
jgi:HSP20 family molecular chaperone IbpA